MLQMLADWISAIATSPGQATAAVVVIVLFAVSAAAIAMTLRSALASLVFVTASLCACVSVLVLLMPPMLRIAGVPPAVLSDVSGLPALADHNGDAFVLQQVWQAAESESLAESLASRSPDTRTMIASDMAEVLAESRTASIAIAGFGVDAQDWLELRVPAQVTALSPEPVARPGFRDITHARDFAPGETITVTVDVAAPAAGCLVQASNSAGDELVQQTLAGDGGATLQIAPQAPGRHVLTLSARCADAVPFAREPVAFEVQPPVLARVLLLGGAPSFESRFLLRWLERSGASVAIRTRVSDERFVQRFIGREPLDIDVLTPTVFAQIDLVIADAQALLTMAADERDALLAAQTGHGVLVTVSDAADIAALRQVFPALLERESDVPVSYQVATAAGRTLPLLTRLDVALNSAAVTPVLAASDGAPVVMQLRERAFVNVTLIADSYRWALAGDNTAYAQLWSELVMQTARTGNVMAPQFAGDTLQVGTRARVCVPDSVTQTGIIVTEAEGENYTVAVHVGAVLPGQRCGWFWPRQAGWLRASAGGQVSDAYVYGADARQVVRADRARRATQRMIHAAPISASSAPALTQQTLSRAAVPRHLVLLALLISLLVSWAAQRLGQPEQRH